VPVPAVDIPEGYRQESSSYIIHGICPECSR
jgi:hypothetical protein